MGLRDSVKNTLKKAAKEKVSSFKQVIQSAKPALDKTKRVLNTPVPIPGAKASSQLIKATTIDRSASAQRARKALRSAADLSYTLAESIDTLNTSVWDSVVEANAAAQGLDSGFFMSSHYLQTLERVLPVNITPRYAMICAGQGTDHQVLAVMVMQQIDIGAAQMGKSRRLSAVTKVAPQFQQRVLACGNFLTYGQHGLAMLPDVDPALIWHGVAEVLYRARQADKLRGSTQFVMVKDLHEPYTKAAQHLEHLSFRYVETEPNMVFTIDASWQSHDDYLNSLASKYRSSIRNAVLKPIEEAGCTISTVIDLVTNAKRMHELYASVQSNAQVRPFLLKVDYFQGLKAAAGERMKVSALMQGDKMLGFLVSVLDGETAVAYHIGFDREAAGELPIYLRLLHVGISDAIALGAKRISFGRTALEPKASLGAKPQTFGVLIRHSQPIFNKLIKAGLLGIEHDEAPVRSPFKKAKD
jgi:hypothetical protein